MKIIKSFLLAAAGLFTTTLLHAQEIKAEVGKPRVEIKIPAPVIAPSKNNETDKQGQEVKAKVLTIDPGMGKKSLTADQLKTLNGTAENPKAAVAPMPNTVTQLPTPVNKSAKKEQ